MLRPEVRSSGLSSGQDPSCWRSAATRVQADELARAGSSGVPRPRFRTLVSMKKSFRERYFRAQQSMAKRARFVLRLEPYVAERE